MAKTQQEEEVKKDVIPTTEPNLMEDPEAISERIEKAEEFLVKNRNLLGGIAVGILGVVAAVFFYFNYTKTQNEEAQQEMFQAVYNFEADSLKKALQGGGSQGLEAIADEYAGTDAANQANFYIAVSKLKLGKFDEALEAIEKFSTKDPLLQARAYCIAGDIHMEKGNFEDAASNYQKAAAEGANKHFTPVYLMKLGLAQENLKKYTAAAETYGKVADKYFDTAEAADAKKYKARVEQLAQAN